LKKQNRAVLEISIRVGFTTSMKTAEITRHKQAATGVKPPSTWALFFEIFRKDGIRGVNKGVNAVAVRQCTNWGSRQVGFFLALMVKT
jgi:hypothetical protein